MQTDGRVYKVANIAASSGTGALTTTSFDLNSSTIALYSTSNGDMAFDGSGALWMIIEDTSRQAYIARVNSSTGAVISATLIKTPSGSVLNTTYGGVNGLTIDMVTGQFYVSSVAPAALGVFRLDPTTGNTTSLTTTTYTDLGSCATVPNLPTLSKSFSPSNVTLTGGTATSAFTFRAQG